MILFEVDAVSYTARILTQHRIDDKRLIEFEIVEPQNDRGRTGAIFHPIGIVWWFDRTK